MQRDLSHAKIIWSHHIRVNIFICDKSNFHDLLTGPKHIQQYETLAMSKYNTTSIIYIFIFSKLQFFGF